MGQQGAFWTRTARDRESWRTLAKGYSVHSGIEGHSLECKHHLRQQHERNWIWIWIYTSQTPINGYKRDGTGRAQQLFLYRSPLLLKSSMFIKIVLGGHYSHV